MFGIDGIAVRREKTANRTENLSNNLSNIGEIVTSAIRGGYTLVELMIAITLTLILMYGIASMFSQVTSIMSETERTLIMAGDLRNVKDRLYEDLTHLTVPKLQAPTSQYGFFCYQEGLGADISSIFNNGDYRKPINQSVAINGDKYRANLAYDNIDDVTDKTVGDTDDILSFTARAPEGKWFKGRLLKGFDANGYPVIEIIESEYAEIVWFVRGTTLYRRVLLIIPDNVLQNRLTLANNDLLSQGYAFFKYFDVSVHQNDSGKVEANTLADLANRKNRYGYWRSPVQPHLPQMILDGENYRSAWYWLRLPTLQESATANFVAGTPFGLPLSNDIIDINSWQGSNQHLNYIGLYSNLMNNTLMDEKREFYDYHNLNPKQFKDKDYFFYSNPFIDFWISPYPWREADAFSGILNTAKGTETLSQDIILTNVLSFNVKAWNDISANFVDLGELAERYYINKNINKDDYCCHQIKRKSNGDIDDEDGKVIYVPGWFSTDYNILDNANDFRTLGYYGVDKTGTPAYDLENQSQTSTLYSPFIPAVFDTWTEEYEKEHLRETGLTRRLGYQMSDLPLDGAITSADLPDYPPPYDAELKALQIELRIFDPVSRTIKKTTLEVNLAQ